MFEPFHGLIVEVHMGHPELRCALDLVAFAPPNREPVVLGCDLDRPVLHPLYGVVPGAMAVKELIRPAPEGTTEQLVSEANPEDRDLALREGPNRLQRML